MDFIGDLLESTASGYMGILVNHHWLTKMAIFLPCRKDIDSSELHECFSNKWFAYAAYHTTLLSIAETSLIAHSETQVAPTNVLTTGCRLRSIHRPMARRNGKTRPWNSIHKPSPTTSRITGWNCYLWQSLLTTIPSITQCRWRHSRPTTTTTYQCSASHRKSHQIWRRKYCRSQRYRDWKRLTRFPGRACWKASYGRQNTLAERTWPSKLVTKCGSWLDTSKRLDSQRSSTTCALGSIW